MAKCRPLPSLLLALAILVIWLSLPLGVWAGTKDETNSFEDRPYVAVDDLEQPQAELPEVGTYLLKTILALVLIAGLTYGGVRFLQKTSAFKGNSQWISVYDAQPLGQNKSLYLAEIAGRLMVLGVTDHGINILTEINDEEVAEGIRQEARLNQERISANPANFRNILKSVSEQVSSDKVSLSSNIQGQVDRLRKLAQGVTPDQSRKDETDG